MPVGPGKYDDLCTHVREAADADGAIVIIFAPTGFGFSVQASMDVQLTLPTILREVADQIEQSMRQAGH